MMLVHKALHKVTRPVTVVYHKTPHVEHAGFVSLADAKCGIFTT